MDQIKTGALIRRLRLEQGLTQLALAERLHISDKAVSKWERGTGAPDLALLPPLAEALHVDAQVLLRGELRENAASNGDMEKLRCYRCPHCGNVLFSSDAAEIRCCGKELPPLVPQKPDDDERVLREPIETEWYLTTRHEMTRAHHIAFVALLDGDTLVVKRCYPEWDLSVYLPQVPHGTLLWCCTRHGLFYERF